VIVVGGLLVTPALGIGGRLLDLIQGAPARPEVRAPVWSHDGRRIAFLRRLGQGNWELHVVNADASGQRRLAGDVATDAPGWSLDGRKIAFVGGREGTDGHNFWDKNGIFVVNVDGTGKRVLSRRGEMPAWSPDGRRIAFRFGGRIYVMNADGNERARLSATRAQGVDNALHWSPDGRKIAYETGGYYCAQVHVVNADGSGERYLVGGPSIGPGESNPAACYASVAWSHDGRRIAFVKSVPIAPVYVRQDLVSAIYVMDADGRRQRKLTHYAEHDSGASWSPDGRKIAFTSALVDFPNSSGEIYVVNADGSGRRNLTRNTAHDFAPAWSPDGRKIVFVSNRDGSYEVYVMNADGSGQRKLTQRGG